MNERTIARFRAKVDTRGPDECWPWTGGSLREGYGRMRVNGRVEGSHRIAFYLEHGRWPEPCALHECDNRPCCNPRHLFEGTRSDNAADRDAKGRNVAPPHPGTREEHVGAKLTETNAMLIRFLCDQGARIIDVAEWFHVSKSLVSLVKRRERWQNSSDGG